jgi:hypothetical protein
LYDAATSNATKFVTNMLNVTGNVGIGTMAPAARLHVAGAMLVDGNLNASTVTAATFTGALNGNAASASTVNVFYTNPVTATADQIAFAFPSSSAQLFAVTVSGVERGIVHSRTSGMLMCPGNQQASTFFSFGNNAGYLQTPFVSGETLVANVNNGFGNYSWSCRYTPLH